VAGASAGKKRKALKRERTSFERPQLDDGRLGFLQRLIQLETSQFHFRLLLQLHLHSRCTRTSTAHSSGDAVTSRTVQKLHHTLCTILFTPFTSVTSFHHVQLSPSENYITVVQPPSHQLNDGMAHRINI